MDSLTMVPVNKKKTYDKATEEQRSCIRIAMV